MRISNKNNNNLIDIIISRAMVRENSGPATAVVASPLVKQVIVLLEKNDVSPEKKDGRTVSRWRRVLTSYQNIRELVTTHDRLMKETNLQLYEINQTTLMKWYENINNYQQHVLNIGYKFKTINIYSLIYCTSRWNNRQKQMEKRILM